MSGHELRPDPDEVARFRDLAEIGGDWYWETDAEHRYTDFFKAQRMRECAGVEAPELIGRQRLEFLATLGDDDSIRAAIEIAERHEIYDGLVVRWPRPDGVLGRFLFYGRPRFDASGRFLGYRGSTREVTDSLGASWHSEALDHVSAAISGAASVETMLEAALAAVLDVFAADRAWLDYPCDPAAPHFVAVTEVCRPEYPGLGATGERVAMSPGMAALMRAALASELPVTGPGEDPAAGPFGSARAYAVRSRMCTALRPREATPWMLGLHQCAYARRWTPDEQRLFRDVATRVQDALTVLLLVRRLEDDIAERERAEARERALQEQLRRSQKLEAIGALTGGIAHDFNNILASILGYAGLALERHAPDPGSDLHRYLGEIRSAGERASALVRQMLEFSRGGASEPRATDVSGVVDEAVRMLRATVPASVDIRVHRAPDTPPVCIDPLQLLQVILNLGVNARDATESSGHVEFESGVAAATGATCASCGAPIAGAHVALAVRDSGAGIAPEVVARMFDPFYTTKAPGHGTGMGLAVVHGIVHEAGGHVVVESDPGAGTRVSVLLPPTQAEPESEPGADAPRAGAPARRARVLVVDDEPTLARLFAEVLEGEGHEVDALTDPCEALARFLADPARYDAVVTDQTMPGMTGARLVRALLAQRPDIPVVICTGYSEGLDEATALGLGARALLAKPVAGRALVDALDPLLPRTRRARAAG